jgi:hypothetical protein
MILVLVHWKIRDDDSAEAEFLGQWRQSNPDRDRGGLIAEILSRAGEHPSFGPLPSAVAGCRNFYTFGMWTSLDAFTAQIGPRFSKRYGFEEEDRVRHLFTPDSWRRGGAEFPSVNSPGTA